MYVYAYIHTCICVYVRTYIYVCVCEGSRTSCGNSSEPQCVQVPHDLHPQWCLGDIPGAQRGTDRSGASDLVRVRAFDRPRLVESRHDGRT